MTDSVTPTLTREEWLAKAQTLSEALPYMRRYDGKIIVVKYGGHAMGNPELARQFANDIVLLKQVGAYPIVVHGGGPQIGKLLDRLQIKSEFIDGLRVTDKDTMEIAEMVLSGSINKEIVALINDAGGDAIGLSGKDDDLIEARKATRTKRDPDSNIERVVDLGFVGEPFRINPQILHKLRHAGFIPVIAPIGIGEDGQTYNINADTAAGAIAAAIDASRLLLLTDVAGFLNKQKELVPELSVGEARTAIADGTALGGMIPKLETCIDAVVGGVEGAVILDGRVPHAILLEIFTEGGAGTLVGKK